MTTDGHRRDGRPGDIAVPVATTLAALTAAASVAWAAATPVHASPVASSATGAPSVDPTVQQQLTAFQQSLEVVRRDLLTLRSVHMPTAHLASNVSRSADLFAGSAASSGFVPAAPAPAVAAQPPMTHTCTGASGAPC